MRNKCVRSLLTLVAMMCMAGPGYAAKVVHKKNNPLIEARHPKVALQTSKGTIVLRLFADKAPVSVRNFLTYVESGFYDGLIFHRVIPDFMMQGGGFDQNLVQKQTTQAAIKNEADNGLTNRRGTVAMARTSVVDSATSQFFINFKDNPALDHTPQSFGYAVFGEVIEGMDVVEAVRGVGTRCPSWTGEPCLESLPGGLRDVPKDPIVIIKAYKK